MQIPVMRCHAGPSSCPRSRVPPFRSIVASKEGSTSRAVAVVGGGVIGLTTALRVLQQLPGTRLVVLAEKLGSTTTSWGAAGIWLPYKVAGTPAMHEWGKDTFNHLVGLYQSDQAVPAGVSSVYGCSVFAEPEDDPEWIDIVHGFGRMDKAALDFFPGGWVDGYHYHTMVCEGRLYMEWLKKQIVELGGTIDQRRVEKLEELGGFDAVMNCAGLEGPSLTPPSSADQLVYPIRGQIMKVSAPWVNVCVMSDPFYIIPNRDWVVLGGTAQYGDFNTSVSLEDKEVIWEGCCALMPSLRGAEVLEDWVGLRPGRSGSIRVESEHVATPGLPKLLVHNYGHGGSGLTLAWGCAGEAVRLLQEGLGLQPGAAKL